MIALFIIAFVLLAATAYTLYRRQHESSDDRAQLQSKFMSPRSLFDGKEADPENQRLLAAQARTETEEKNALLIQRGLEGDLTALAEAHRAHNSTLYGSVLDGLLKWAATSENNLRSLAAFVANDSNLRGSPALAEVYTKLWQQQPDRQTTAQLLHLAALSDDADTFERAIVATRNYLLAGRLAEIKSEELSALIESEYWVLSSVARRTGAGFILKEKMSGWREELVPSQTTESPHVKS